ncbi:hypothetical protein BC835DRAFT_1303798 [Cytidiella melzeri]|nr:hypothetical protein BC835DRAFT_1303798 [Cytidiella melzeri]
MAQPMSPVVPTQPSQAASSVTRSNSIKSTNSASSGVSLRRRARTRTRTLTNSARRGRSTGPGGASQQEPSVKKGESAVVTRPSRIDHPPPIPTRSPRRPLAPTADAPSGAQLIVVPTARERRYSAVQIRDVPAEVGRGRLSHSDGGSTRNTNRKNRGVSLPRSAFRNAASSDESSEASPRTPTDFNEAAFVRFPRGDPQATGRDSLISSSSSLYPASTSSGSFPESSLLHSPKEKGGEESSFAPRIVTSSDFDVDDVSYRLRLLVNNNYFLPPAHHKPSPLSLTPQIPSQAQKAAKPVSPGFFDFLRMGKAKSKPVTPICSSPPALDNPPPLLGTTSNSTTAGGYVQRPPEVPTLQMPVGTANSSSQSRVVVLRERMDDLMAAAKQAERDIKSRGNGRKAKSLTSPKATYDDIIDPTDAVDLPPSTAYPFTVQTSALHGLGPGESMGADLLADQLPPSPGMWSMSSEEESWRKAILKEAVSLSLSESPDQSLSTVTLSSPEPTSPKSFRLHREGKTEAEEPASPTTPKPTALIGQRIMEPLRLDSSTQDATSLSPLTGVRSLPSGPSSGGDTQLAAEQAEKPWRATLNPPRAETPAMTQPLTPPPLRKTLLAPQHSISTDDLRKSSNLELESMAVRSLRRAISSPRLSAVHDQDSNVPACVTSSESIGQRLAVMSPLDLAAQDRKTWSTRAPTLNLSRASPLLSDDDDASYATPMDEMDDEPHSRPSTTLSIPTIGRQSLTEYSVPSPTASAFQDAILQDAVFGSCRSPSPFRVRRSHPSSISPSSPPTTRPPFVSRHMTVTPPPRDSSTFGTVLPPPPRSPAIKPIYRPSTASSHLSTHTAGTDMSAPLYSEMKHRNEMISNLSLSRSPSIDRSPRSALVERRGLPILLSLQIPTEVTSPAVHSAPAPASPTAFFDRIQSHPNAMDDLETSDESDRDEEVSARPVPAAVIPSPFPMPPVSSGSVEKDAFARFSQSSARLSIMRLGNHSSPHLTSSSGDQERTFPAFDVPDPRKPIGNIPDKGTFFTARSRKKSSKGQATFPPPLELPSAAPMFSPPRASSSMPRTRSKSTSRRPATSGGAKEKLRAGQRVSLQKLDGMVLEHMAAERDTIKRITNNLSSAKS